MEVDSPLLKVPFESLKRAAKDRKSLVDDVVEAVGTVSKLPKGSSKEDQLAHIRSILSNLQGIKRKLEDVSQVERDEAQRCRARLEHLQAVGPPRPGQAVAWTKQRLDRLLVDHMLRRGLYNSAHELSAAVNIELLVDSHIFCDARKVVEALRQRDLTEPLAWCAENRVKLKRIKSKLEFKLRLQEFIELVRDGRQLEALQVARSSLAPWAVGAPAHMATMQRVFATLAFARHASSSSSSSARKAAAGQETGQEGVSPKSPAVSSAATAGGAEAMMESPTHNAGGTTGRTTGGTGTAVGGTPATPADVNGAGSGMEATNEGRGGGISGGTHTGGTTCSTAVAWPPQLSAYAALFDDTQWGQLVELFLDELNRLHSLTPESLLTIHLQAGLSALRTPRHPSREDPLHLPAFQTLAQGLPYAKHVHSKLFCRVTKEVMNDANPPMVLPNGYVYSRKAVEMLSAQNGGRMVCPKTGADFGMEELRRAYVV